MEEDLHSVAPGRYDWRQEVVVFRWSSIRVAAALVHQGCPIPIRYLDVVACAGGDGDVFTTRQNGKAGELQPQYFPALNLYRLCFVKVGRIVARVVW